MYSPKNIIMIVLLSLSAIAKAQSINWKNLTAKDKQFVSASINAAYGLIYEVGYGYHVNAHVPVVLHAAYSFPSGNKLTDDFKTRLGATFQIYEVNNVRFSANVYGVFRRYENDFVRLLNFGSDLSGIIGFYKTKWFAAAELGFDKAIVTNFKHSSFYKNNFPSVKDGWYQPATGGNFYYALQAGYSFHRNDIYLKAGKIITQDFTTSPSIPFYGQLGFNFKFRHK